mgnify:CR=1 FL=1
MDFRHYILNFLKLFFFISIANTSVLAESQYQYNIPAQPLNDGLIQFAADSNLELIYTADKIRGLKSRALQGQMTVKQALDFLLLESGYTFQFIDTNTITIIPQTETVDVYTEQSDVNQWNQFDSVRTLLPLTVVGINAKYQGKRNSPKSYNHSHTNSSTRTSTAIKEIPQSIQLITRALIDDQGSLTVSESLKNISGVSVGQAALTPSFDFTQIRGFRAEQLLDGFTQYYNAGDRESLVNVERIEVLKGSNALLYGGGSGAPPGGLVNIVSKKPEQETIVKAGVKYGSYQYYQPYIDINQPLSEHILFRVTGEYTDAGSYLDVIETERYNVNPALTITDNKGTQLTVQGKISSWEQVDYQGLPAHGSVTGDFNIKPESYIGPSDIEPSQAKFYGVWGSFEHELDESWHLSLKARYSESKFDQKIQTLFGADGIKADQPYLTPSTWALFNTELYQEQQELSFVANVIANFKVGPTENTILLGADYSEFKDEGFIESASAETVDLGKISFNSPYSKPGAGINNIFVVNKTYGGYVQLQTALYDRLHILTGLRIGSVDIAYNNESFGFEAVSQTSKTMFLPRIGASYDLTNNISSFISYSEGMRGQPFVNFVATPSPELSQHIEAGIKFDFLNAFNGQVAVYQINRSHVAIRDNTDAKGRSETTGEQRSQGVEVDLTWQLENIDLLTSYAYTDARYIKHQTESSNGKPLPHIPNHSGKIWANYRFGQAVLSGFSLGAGVYFQSGVYLEVPGYNKSDGLFSVDAALNYEADSFKISAAFKNITNEKNYQSLNYFGGRFVPTQPFSAYLNLSIQY